MRIPMSSPNITSAEVAAVQQVLQTPILSLGPHIDSFEQNLAAYIGTSYGVGVNSGTSGLHLAVIAAGVKQDNIVITTPFSFIASANCILYERAIPIFVDVDPLTGNINPTLVSEAVQDFFSGSAAYRHWLPPALRNSYQEFNRNQPGAILPVHAFGQPADMDPILEVARQYNIPVIEDSCEAIGAEYKGRKVGTLSDAAVFAFYPNKQITTGEGGMIVTNRQEWNDLFRSLRNQGRDTFNAWLNHTRLGYNYRLDELSAALGRVQLERIEEILTRREQVAQWYHERLRDIEVIELPRTVPTTTRMSWFVYVVRIMPPANRDALMRALSAVQIPSRPYFTPIHLQPFYRHQFGYQRGDFPVTESLGDVSLALPFSSIMTEDQVDYVCHHVRSCLHLCSATSTG